MNKFLRNIRFQIGILFLVSLSGIIVVNILCNFDIIEYKQSYTGTLSPNDQKAHDHSKNNEPSNKHDNDQHRHHDDNNAGPHNHGNNDSHEEADSCCEDLTQSVFHNLVKPKPVSFNLNFQPFVLYPLFSTYRTEFIISENIFTSVREVANPPPLSGMDIRINIQSFRN